MGFLHGKKGAMHDDSLPHGGPGRGRWKWERVRGPVHAILILAGLGYSGWMIAFSYRLDVPVFFFGGILATCALLWIARCRWPGVVMHNIAATLVLAGVALCILDVVQVLRRPPGRVPGVRAERSPETQEAMVRDRAFSFSVARGDPALFRAWWSMLSGEWERLFKAVKLPDPARHVPFKLRPGAEMQFVRSRISINSLGFRDREFRREKQGRYRIVALGESTTMGVTLMPTDKPWPALLQSLIRSASNAPVPVQVINAGVAAYTIEAGIMRLRDEVLALDPDMIISYHGYNGFDFLASATPVLQESLPKRIPRPSPTLAGLEHGWRLKRFRERNFRPDPDSADLGRLTDGMMDSHYAAMYRELISIARSRGIPLVLVGFNMAVNESSPPEVIRFYRGGFPSVSFSILANRVHNLLIAALAAENDGVYFVDASEGLDGVHEQFIDLVHFTQTGREILADHVHAGIGELLEAEWDARGAGSKSGG